MLLNIYLVGTLFTEWKSLKGGDIKKAKPEQFVERYVSYGWMRSYQKKKNKGGKIHEEKGI